MRQLPPEKLLKKACTPTNPVSRPEVDRLEAAELIAHRNFQDLKKFVDGEMESGGCLIVCPGDEPEKLPLTAFESERSRLHKYLHNYLASIYSFNEQVRELINRKIGDEDSTDSPLGRGAFVPNNRTLYTQELAFARGLRVDAQHGEFSAINLKPTDHPPVDTDEADDVYWIQFDKDSFRNGATTNPDKYLSDKKDSSFDRPLEYLYSFHRDHFVEFAQETEHWFERGIQ